MADGCRLTRCGRLRWWKCPHDGGEQAEHKQIVSCDTPPGFGRKVVREEAVASSYSHHEKDALAEKQRESHAYGQESDAFNFIHRRNSLAAVENPNRDEVQYVKPSAGARKRRPNPVTGFPPDQRASYGSDPSGEGSGQTDERARFARYAD